MKFKLVFRSLYFYWDSAIDIEAVKHLIDIAGFYFSDDGMT